LEKNSEKMFRIFKRKENLKEKVKELKERIAKISKTGDIYNKYGKIKPEIKNIINITIETTPILEKLKEKANELKNFSEKEQEKKLKEFMPQFIENAWQEYKKMKFDVLEKTTKEFLNFEIIMYHFFNEIKEKQQINVPLKELEKILRKQEYRKERKQMKTEELNDTKIITRKIEKTKNQ